MQKSFPRINGFLLIVIGGFFLLMASLEEDALQSSEQSSQSEKPNKKPIELINEHLQESYDKSLIDKLNVINQNRVLAPALKDSKEEAVLTESEIEALYGGANYEDLIRNELNTRNAIEDKRYRDELEQKEEAEREEEQKKYRQRYAPTFIEMARKDGYEIELDENYYVKSVDKIKDSKKTENKKYPQYKK